MTADQELNEWMNDWHAAAEPLNVVKEKVRRQGVMQMASTVAEILAAIALIGIPAEIARRNPSPDVFAWFVICFAFTAVASTFSFNNFRGTWRPTAESTRAYLELAVKRAEARLRAADFGWNLLGLEVVFVSVWCVIRWAQGGLDTGELFFRLGLVPVLSIPLTGWLLWSQRRARVDLRELRGVGEG